jgi:hypothetical protein
MAPYISVPPPFPAKPRPDVPESPGGMDEADFVGHKGRNDLSGGAERKASPP